MINYAGSNNAEIAFIGEAPQLEDIEEGKPFSGKAGSRLMGLINRAGLCREDVKLMYVSRHRPEEDNLSNLWVDKKQTVPTSILGDDIQFLKNTILKMPNLKMIICLGRQPMYILTGLDSIIKQRGTILKYKGVKKDVNILMTLSPYFLLRNPGLNIVVLMDIKKAVRNINTKKLLPNRKLVVYPTNKDWEFFYQRALNSPDPLSVDIETRFGQITRLGMCVDSEYAISIPFTNINTGHKYSNNYIWPGFNKLLEKKRVVGQNFLNYDIFWLENYGCYFPNHIFDTMIAQHCILPGLPKLLKPMSLSFLGSIHTNEPYYKDEAKDQDKKPPNDKVYGEYNCKDVLTTLEAYKQQIKHPHFTENLHTFNFESKLARTTLHNITVTGVLLNEPYRQKLKERAELECEYLSLKVAEKIGRLINLRSPKQVANLLYTELKLKPQYNTISKEGKRIKTITTDELACKKLKALYSKYIIRELDWILQFRTVDQLKKGILSTKIDVDGRIRCTVTQTTETGRLASTSSPFWTGQSLHVIPRDPKIRKMFLPDKEVWVHRDLSQAEAWVTYYLAGAKKMLARMRNGEKPHQIMASVISGKKYEESGKGTKEYALGKKVVHASNYLIGPKTLALSILKELGISITMTQAKNYIAAYYKLVPEIPIWHMSLLTELRYNGLQLTNSFGRVGRFFGFFNGTVKGSNKILHEAAAFKPQSTIGDLLNKIILKWEKERTIGELIIPVHDETNTQCDWKELDTHLEELDTAYNYPITVGEYKDVIIPWDTSICKNWGEEFSREEIKRYGYK